MYRFLLSGRWITLLMVGLVLVALFVLAGFWQLGKFRSAAPTSDVSTSAEQDPAPDQVARRPGGDGQNLGYALQWWAFAGAVIYFGIRAVRMEAEDRLKPPAQPPEESDAARP